MLELLYGEPDLDIGAKAIVESVHIPMPPKGMYVWGHKVLSHACIYPMCLINL